MLVKACGLRSIEELYWAVELGYDFYGFVIEPKSKRDILPSELQQIWREIPNPSWKERCVFVARKWQALLAYSYYCPEALLQCYDEYPEFIHSTRRFLPVSGEEEWQLCSMQQSAAYFLYDVSLGSGDWRGLPSWCCDKAQLFVAGGLNEEHLEELRSSQRGHRFFGFDLSSGLEGPHDENGRSRKDYQKMKNCLGIIRSSFL